MNTGLWPSTRLPAIPWTLQRTVAPSAFLTTADVKTHIRETLVDTANDALIDVFARAAEDAIEKELSRALMQQTWVLRLGRFPAGEIRLPRPPLGSISSISYLDTSGSPIVLDPSQYTVDTSPEPGRILLPYQIAWPSTRAIDNAVTITYVVGHATAGAVPAALKVAVSLLAAEMYENRERGQVDVSSWVENPTHERLVASYRINTEFNYQ